MQQVLATGCAAADGDGKARCADADGGCTAIVPAASGAEADGTDNSLVAVPRHLTL